MKREVICFGLQFSKNEDIIKWGVAIFSKQGKLLEEHGPEEPSERYSLDDKYGPVQLPCQFDANN